MARLAAHLHLVAGAAGQRRRTGSRPGPGCRRCWSSVTTDSALPSLIRRHRPCPAPVSSRSSVVLPAPFGADDAEPVAAQHAQVQVAHDRPVVERLRHAFRHRHQLAGQPRAAGFQLQPLRAVHRVPPGLAQRLPARPAAHVALAPRGDAVAHPVLLPRDLPVELVPVALLLFQHLLAPAFEPPETLVEPTRAAAVQPHHAARQRLQQPAVVADHHHGRGRRQQLALPATRWSACPGGWSARPAAAGPGQGPGHGPAPPGAPPRRTADAGPRSRPARARTAVRRAMPGIVGPEPGPHVVQRGGMAGQVGLLRQRAQRGARLQEPRAGIRQQLAGRDAQQGRLARAVPPHQAQPLAGRHPEAGAVQQRRAAEGQPYVLEQKQGRRHGAVLADAARLRNTAAGCGYFAAVWCSACCRNNRSATCFC